jgi:hypothetical protein
MTPKKPGAPANWAPPVGSRQLNQNNPAERLREGLRLFLKLKIDA